MDSFTYQAITLDLPLPPSQDSGIQKSISANMAYDTDGYLISYMYSDKQRSTSTLLIAPISKILTNTIINFLNTTVPGVGHAFTWVDSFGVSKDITRISPIRTTKLAGAYYSVSFTVEEV